MKPYQVELIRVLQISHWEIEEISEGGSWAEREHWLLSSTHKPMKIWLSFLTAPDETFRPVVDEVFAAKEKCGHVMEEDLCIAVLSMRQGLFNENLEGFIKSINLYRENEN